jgi:NADPH:quinone reductase-like Zn-dependent oxidoreductase
MKAIQLTHFGPPEVLVYTEVPTPEPGAGEILIKVESAAVNFSDVMRRAAMTYPFPTPLPFIPGSEVAGTVAALGAGVAGPPVGASVFALSADGSRGYAEYTVANANQVIPIPPRLSADEACALIVAGLTAALLLEEVTHLRAGESVLIPGAGGGVGGFAIQIARLLGAGTIIGATSSSAKHGAARTAGADHVVDYTQSDWTTQVWELTNGRGVDVVLEMSGGDVFAQSMRCLAPFGRAAVYGMASGEPLRFDGDTLMRFFYDPAPSQSLHVFNLGLWFGRRPETSMTALQRLIGYTASGQISVPLGRTFPLAQAAEAHRLLESRASIGKLVLKPWR